MAKQIALLRAVNLAGHNRVGMPALCALLVELGCSDVRSWLQSGNLVFSVGAGKKTATLEDALRDLAKRKLGLDTDFFVRTAKEWRAIVAANAFPAEAEVDPGHVVVVCCNGKLRAEQVAELQQAIKGRERVRAKASGRELYIHYPDGIGESRLTMALIERKLGVRGTGRNWNTVRKLDALVSATADDAG